MRDRMPLRRPDAVPHLVTTRTPTGTAMRPPFRPALVAALALGCAFLGACGRDVTAPAIAPAERPAFLLGPYESQRTILDTVDASFNHVTIVEWAAGTYTDADGAAASVASVTIKTIAPMGVSGIASSYCITSTIEKVEITPGWRYQIKKPGGCNAEIRVGLQNPATKQKADFSYLYMPGKTKIDFGAVQ